MKQEVVVLISTYNGEKYIVEQINSILEQEYEGMITIQVRDDGSTDRTIDVIKNITCPHNRRLYINKGKNKGPQKSFLTLIKNAKDADYYFFSDQDDIWLRHKISEAVAKMPNHTNTPVCYCSNYYLTNTDLVILKNGIDEKPLFQPLSILFYNKIPGCVMGFNRTLMDLLKRIDVNNVMMHDSYVLAFCSVVGEIIYDDKCTIYHRIHEGNVIGDGHKKIVPHKWIVDKTKLLIKKEEYDLSEIASSFLKFIDLSNPYYGDLVLLRDYKKSYRNTFRLLDHPQSKSTFMDRTTLSIRSKIFFHVF